jgi:hypothetical protein
MKLSTFAKRGSRNRKIRNIFQKLFLFFFLEIDKRSFLNRKFFLLSSIMSSALFKLVSTEAEEI